MLTTCQYLSCSYFLAERSHRSFLDWRASHQQCYQRINAWSSICNTLFHWVYLPFRVTWTIPPLWQVSASLVRVVRHISTSQLISASRSLPIVPAPQNIHEERYFIGFLRYGSQILNKYCRSRHLGSIWDIRMWKVSPVSRFFRFLQLRSLFFILFQDKGPPWYSDLWPMDVTGFSFLSNSTTILMKLSINNLRLLAFCRHGTLWIAS